MKLENIKVALAYESATNPRGKDFEGQAFDDLVASVKEKGVLVPVIVRTKQKGDKVFEVIAGNRRLRAAKTVGLDEIPARIENYDDNQAREVQIIENLQREDIHPLDEGEAYRQLIEKSKFEISVVAAKVGKPESYIRSRLFITNIVDKVKTALRADKITLGHALLMARLEEPQQLKALKYCLDRYNTPSVNDLKEWIECNIYNDLKKLTWLNDKKLIEKVGSCNDCGAMKRNSLFPDKETPKNCINPDCLTLKKKAYIDMKTSEEKLVKVSTEYGNAKGKGVVAKDKYINVGSKKDNHCESTKKAIVVEGDNFGSILYICMDDKCKKHKAYQSSYSLTPKEKEARKKELEKAKQKELERISKFRQAIEKVKFPLIEKQLDALLDFAFYRCGRSLQQPTVKYLGVEVIKKEEKSWDDTKKKRMVSDYEASLKKYAADNGNNGKLSVIFALLIPHPSNYSDDNDFTKAVNKLIN